MNLDRAAYDLLSDTVKPIPVVHFNFTFLCALCDLCG